MARPERKRLVLAFWAAVGVSILIHLAQPYGRFLLYPFVMLSTWVHEMGHGLTALVLGGEFVELVMLPTGGYARHTATGFFQRPLVSMGGLLGPAVAGAAVIIFGARSERAARSVLAALAASLVLSVALWIRDPFSLGVVGAIAGALVLVAWKGNEFLELVVTQLVGIQFCLGSLSDFDYMFTKNFQRGGTTQNSDTQNIAESLLLPYWFWGGLIAAISLAILGFAFYVAWIRPALGEPAEAQPPGPGSPQAPQAEAILDELGGPHSV